MSLTVLAFGLVALGAFFLASADSLAFFPLASAGTLALVSVPSLLSSMSLTVLAFGLVALGAFFLASADSLAFFPLASAGTLALVSVPSFRSTLAARSSLAACTSLAASTSSTPASSSSVPVMEALESSSGQFRSCHDFRTSFSTFSHKALFALNSSVIFSLPWTFKSPYVSQAPPFWIMPSDTAASNTLLSQEIPFLLPV